MRCRRARTLIERALEDRWTLDERFALEEHFDGCARCQREYARSRAIEEALQRRPEPPLERLDVEAAVRAIRARTEPASERSRAQPLRNSRRPVRRVALAAGIALAFGGAFFGAWSSWGSGSGVPISTAPETARVEIVGADADLTDSHEDTAVSASVPPVIEPAPVIETDPIDPERLARVRTEIRELLSSAGRDLSVEASFEEAAEFARTFDVAAASWADSDWPIARLVTGALDDSAVDVRRAAARYLGQRGDRLGVAALVRRLDDASGPALTVEVPCALLDAIERGHAVPTELVRRLEYADWMVERTRARADVAARVAELLIATRAEDFERVWIAALPRLGRAGVEALVDVGLRGPKRRDRIAAELAHVCGTARAVVGPRLEEIGRIDLGWALELCARLQPVEGPDWLVRRIHDGTGGVAALELLPELRGTRALELAIELWEAGTLGRGGPAAAFVRRVERAPAELESLVAQGLAQLFFERAEPTKSVAWMDFAIAADTPAALPALVAIVRSPLAGLARRRASADALAELARAPEVADELVRIVRRSSRSQAALAASLLVAIHADRGFEGLCDALPNAPQPVLLDIEHELNSSELSRRRTAALVRIAHSIEPVLDGRVRATRTTP